MGSYRGYAFQYFCWPWLPSVEKKLKNCLWDDFCKLVLDRFGRDHHELLIRQLLGIRQTGTIAEYVEKFSKLVDQLSAYDGRADPLYFILRFVEGLKGEIKSAVLIQRPTELDTAFVLAQLQEEVSAPVKKMDVRRSNYSYQNRHSFAAPLPLPPPPKSDKPQSVKDTDRRATDASRARTTDDRFVALHSYCRAQGLCQWCVESWSKGHRCADKVQLNALQELMEVFQISETADPGDATADSVDELFLTLSIAAISGNPSSRSMCLLGIVQDHPIRILVDSGSSHTFIS